MHWVCWGSSSSTLSTQERIERIQELVRELNRQCLYQAEVIRRHQTQGLQYLNQGDEQMAQGEAELQLHAQEQRQALVDLYVKTRLLLREIEHAQSMALTADVLSKASGVMKDIILDVKSVDEQMVRLEEGVARVRNVTKSLTHKPQTSELRQMFQTPLPDLPRDLPKDAPDVVIQPSVTLEL